MPRLALMSVLAIRASVVGAGTLLLAACAQDKTVSSVPGSPVGTGTLNVADAAIAGGDPTMALSVTQSVLADDPNNVDALVHEGNAYYALGRCQPAEAAYQLALAHDAKATAAETGLGRCLLKTDPTEAEAAFMAAVQDDPGNAKALNDLGIARDLEGHFAAAADAYKQALLADPSMTAVEVNLGLSLALSGNGPAALQYLGPLATGQSATPKIREDYAAALLAAGRDDEARQVLSIDLPPYQVASAMDGFAEVIAKSQENPPPPPPPAPTVATVRTMPVSVQSSSGPASSGPAVLTPASAKPPASVAALLPTYVPDNSTAAYTGPSPIPVTASSSTPGPGRPPATPVAADPPAAHAMHQAAANVAASSTDAGPAAGEGAAVQLGALNSSDAAQHDWDSLNAASPALFSGKSPLIQSATVDGKLYYRLRVTGFSSHADAAHFCSQVTAAGHACTVANF